MRKTLSYDDVLLKPQYSDITSRKEVDISTTLGPNLTLTLPIIASPMDTISGFEMAQTISRMGGMAIIHRYMDVIEQCKIVTDIKNDGDTVVGAAIGTGDEAVIRAQALCAAGVDVLCVDVAHGHHQLVRKTLSILRPKVEAHGVHLSLIHI